MYLSLQPAPPPAPALFIRGFEPQELALLRRAWTGTREIARHAPLIGEGRPELVAIGRGWAGRIIEDGEQRRQILDLLIRGDVCGLDAMIPGTPPDDIRALTPLTVDCFDAAIVADLVAACPGLSWALLRHAILQNGASRLGQHRMRVRGATRRMAALIGDLAHRLTAGGVADAAGPYIPLTQLDLADATGLTAIHVNRVVAGLRLAGIISTDGRKLRVTDWPALRAAAQA